MWHKPCRTFHPWCPCIKTRCLYLLSSKCDWHRCSKNALNISRYQTETELWVACNDISEIIFFYWRFFKQMIGHHWKTRVVMMLTLSSCYQHYWRFVRGIYRPPKYSFEKGPVIPIFGVSFVVSLEKAVEKIELSVIWYGMTILWCHCNAYLEVL